MKHGGFIIHAPTTEIILLRISTEVLITQNDMESSVGRESDIPSKVVNEIVSVVARPSTRVFPAFSIFPAFEGDLDGAPDGESDGTSDGAPDGASDGAPDAGDSVGLDMDMDLPTAVKSLKSTTRRRAKGYTAVILIMVRKIMVLVN
jgi:hypothetical protein